MQRRLDRVWRTIVADKDPMFCERLREGLRQQSRFEVVADCFNGAEVLGAVQRHQPDLLFLDVTIENLASVRKLRSLADPPFIVFIAEPERLGGIRIRKAQFVERTYEGGRLMENLANLDLGKYDSKAKQSQYRLLRRLPRLHNSQRLAIKGSGGILVFDVAEIACIESDGNYLYFHTRSGFHRIRGSFVDIADKLENDSFFQINSGTVVNLYYVRELRFQPGAAPTVILNNGQSFPTVRRHVQDLTKRIDSLWTRGA